MALPCDAPEFEHVADARRLIAHPEIHFDTKRARLMIAACLALIDQQREAVQQFDEMVWRGAHQAGARYGYYVGGSMGLMAGILIGVMARGWLG